MNDSVNDFLSSQPYADTTRRTYANILSRFVVECPDPTQLTASGLLAFLKKKEWGNSRQCVALAACQKYLSWTCGQNHPALRARLKRIDCGPQRAIDEETALKLFASFNTYTPKGSRDLAIATLALDTGLRSSELCRLQQSDTNTERGVLQVIVKGGQLKAAIFTPETAAHVERWKAYRKDLDPQGFLFVSTSKHKGHGLTPNGLNSIVKIWGETIGIKLSPHDFRRGMTVQASKNGASDRALMDMGRWSSTDMPRRYTKTFRLEFARPYLPMTNLKK